MHIDILETTVPASADCGVRTFQVRSVGPDGVPLTAVDVSVCGLEDKALHDEAPELLEIHDRVPSNAAVGNALINLGTALLNTVGSRLCNPDD
jgi:hypothetical protein